MSFSLEDVRSQLSKLGYENVPDQVIQKFMARMAQKQDLAAAASPATTTTTAPAEPIQVPAATPLPPYPHLQQHPAHAKPYDTAVLPPPVNYVSPYGNLAVSNPHYSSLAQPTITHPAVSYVPNLPLSLRNNPAFLAQQTAYQPAPLFGPSVIPAHPLTAPAPAAPVAAAPVASSRSPSRAPSSYRSKSSVLVEDGGNTSEDEEDRADREFEAAKAKELQKLEERLQKHAAVAHGVREIIDPIHRQQQAQAAKENPSTGPTASRATRGFVGSGRGFGQERSDNLPQYAQVPERGSFQIPIKSAQQQQHQQEQRTAREDAAVRAAQKELQQRGMQRSLSARSISSHAARPRASSSASTSQVDSSSLGRSQSTARLASRSEDRRHAATDAWARGDVDQVEVVEVDTQRSLRKTYANSVQKFKQLNPRYGAGGYRKSDPVTRYHAFKTKWDGSTFLNKKTQQMTATTTAGGVIAAKAPAWKA